MENKRGESMSKWKEIKALPSHLQPKILSAVAYINSAAPNMSKSVERINTLLKHLSDKEMTYVMSLLVFDKIIDDVMIMIATTSPSIIFIPCTIATSSFRLVYSAEVIDSHISKLIEPIILTLH